MAFLLIGSIVVYGILRKRVASGNRSVAPDPWPPEVAESILRDDAQPLCPACLEPHSDHVHFCAKCGSPIGEFVTYLPFERIFAEGHILRIGTSGNLRPGWFHTVGLGLLAFGAYGVLAPIYWVLLVRNWIRCRSASTRSEPDPAVAPPPLPPS